MPKDKIKGQVIFRAGAEIKDHNGVQFKLPAQRRAGEKNFAQERLDRKERMRKLRDGGNTPSEHEGLTYEKIAHATKLLKESKVPNE